MSRRFVRRFVAVVVLFFVVVSIVVVAIALLIGALLGQGGPPPSTGRLRLLRGRAAPWERRLGARAWASPGW